MLYSRVWGTLNALRLLHGTVKTPSNIPAAMPTDHLAKNKPVGSCVHLTLTAVWLKSESNSRWQDTAIGKRSYHASKKTRSPACPLNHKETETEQQLEGSRASNLSETYKKTYKKRRKVAFLHHLPNLSISNNSTPWNFVTLKCCFTVC